MAALSQSQTCREIEELKDRPEKAKSGEELLKKASKEEEKEKQALTKRRIDGFDVWQ